ncbi:MAG: hypothetical protein AAGJ93_04910 [Bacteroidota bacterium]
MPSVFAFQIMILSCLPFLLQAQSITESIGGVNTKFIIKSDSVLLNDSQQLIIKRGAYDFSRELNAPANTTLNVGYGYGYESYHLEFTSQQEILTVIQSQRKQARRDEYFLIQLLDQSGVSYRNIELNATEVESISGARSVRDKLYAYSINLNQIPLVVLNDIAEINIIRIER